jgi:peptide/nickel transport system permease protein
VVAQGKATQLLLDRKTAETALGIERGYLRMVTTRFFRHRLAMIGLVMVILVGLLTVLASQLAPYDPATFTLRDRFQAPLQRGHMLGTDEMGRDMVSRLLYAGRISLVVGMVAMLVTVLIGSIVGSISGYYGGLVDSLLMRFTDTMLAFPTVFLLLALAAFIRPTVLSIALIIGVTAWMEVARIVRGQVLSLKRQDFVTATRSVGVRDARIIFRHLLPNTMSSILVAATLNVANAVLMESYISYLGYGIQPPVASWGNMLNNAQAYFDTAPWLAILPGLMITLTVMGFNFVGDGLRDALDPRLWI